VWLVVRSRDRANPPTCEYQEKQLINFRDDLYTVGTLAAREAHYLVPTFPGVHEVTLNPNHFPGPTQAGTLRRFFVRPMNSINVRTGGECLSASDHVVFV
jgi:hypothetical protein